MVADSVAAAAGADQLRTAQPTGGLHPLPGPLVEGGDVGPPPRIQTGLVPGRHVDSPGVDGLLEGAVSVARSVQAALPGVPGDGLSDAAISQLRQAKTFGGIVLTPVLCQLVDDVGVTADQSGERPAWADRPELVVVADEHQLGPGGLDAGGEGDQVGVLGHAYLVENDHAALVEGEPVVVEPPQQAGQRSGLADLRLPAQRASRLPGGRGPDHSAARRLERCRRHGEQSGLPRAGHTHDELGTPPRAADALGRLPLLGGEGGADRFLRHGNRLLHRHRTGDGGVGAPQLAADGVGDGLLGSQHRRQRMRLFASAGHADQGDYFGIPQRPIYHEIERSGVLAEQVRGQFHEHMAAGKHLPPGQFPVRREHFVEHPADALQRQLRGRAEFPSGAINGRG